MSVDEAWNRMAEDEAKALSLLLESEGRKVMVVVIAAETDDLGTTAVLHACSDGTTGRHAMQFRVALERKLRWLKTKMVRGGGN